MPVGIQPESLAQLLKQQSVLLLDVRRPEEHEFVALPNSLLIPLQQLPQRYQEISLKRDQTLVVYCHHGVRSWHAALFLEQHGFQNVCSLEGGIEAWAVELEPNMRRYQ